MTLIQHRRYEATLSSRSAGRWKRSRAIALTLASLVLFAGLWTALVWFAPGGASVARAADTSGEQKVAVFQDAVVKAGETWDNVVVVGGDLIIRGTVLNTVVVVFGDVMIADGAKVGAAVNSEDAALVSVFGDKTIMPGAAVYGRTVDVGGGVAGIDLPIGDPVLRPWRTGAILNWVWSTVFLAVVAVIITAIAPRQVAAVRERVRRHFFSSLGWGALGAIIGVPIVTAALIISIIGIIVVVPWLIIILPIMSLFGLVAVGATVGRLILGAREDRRETLMLAAVLGLVIINLARWIPVAWLVIIGVLWLVGFGATYVAIWAWLRERRRRKRDTAARERAARSAVSGHGGAGPYYAAPSVPPAGQPPTPTSQPTAPASSTPSTPPPAPAPGPQAPTGPPTGPPSGPQGHAPDTLESDPAVPESGAAGDSTSAPGSEAAGEPREGRWPESEGPSPG